MPVRNYTNQELEQVAKDFLSKYASGKYDGRSLRIEALIQALGFYIFPVPGLSEIAEAYIPAKPGYIFVDEDQYQQATISFRWRFTLSEELAHILIHRPMFDGKTSAEITEIQESISDHDYRIIEQNAKFLASCILMPSDSYAERFRHFHAIQSQRSINSLQIHKFVVRQLHMDFNVSCYAVAIRAMKLGLIDQEELDDLLEVF